MHTIVYARLPNGKSVQHGTYVNGVFARTLQSKDIRFSDRSFCVNTAVIPQLKKWEVQFFRFVWIKADERVVYEIQFKKAFEVGKVVTNEYGEENLRIPIDECKIVNRWLDPIKEAKRQEEEEAKQKQTNIFNN